MGRFTDCFSVNCVFFSTILVSIAMLIPLLIPAPLQPIITACQAKQYRNFHTLIEAELAVIEADMIQSPYRWQRRTTATVDDLDFGSGRKIMHIGAMHGDANIVKYLHKRGAGVHHEKADDFRTPLHLAATFNTADVVELLLKYGSKVDARSQSGWTPLLKAVLLSNHDIVSVLLAAGADPNVQLDNGFTVMQCALMYSDERMGMLLIRGGSYIEQGESWYNEFEELKNTLLAAGLLAEDDINQPSAFERRSTDSGANTQRSSALSGDDDLHEAAADWLQQGTAA